jgi:hypothetical protein
MGMPSIPVPQAARQAIQKAAFPVADWLKKNTDLQGGWEKTGGFLQLAHELVLGQGAGETGAATNVMTAGDHAVEVGKVMKMLEGNSVTSRLARLGAKVLQHSATAGGEMGAQSLIHSEDPDKAVSSAEQGLVLGAVTGGIPAAYSEAKDILKPTEATLEGHAMPVLASQMPNAPLATKLIKEPQDLPEFEAQQQAVPPRVIGSGSQRAVKNVLDQVNESRQMQGPLDESGNPPGAFKFSVDRYDPRVEAETPEEAAATRTQSQIGTMATAVPERVGGGPPTGATLRRQQLGSVASTIPESLIRGTASPVAEKFETTDPNDAVKMLTEARQIQRIPNLPARLQARVDARVSDLESQLDEYHQAQAAAPNFKPIDSAKAMQGVHDYETAGDIMQDSVRDVYNRMDAATDGEMTKLIQQPRAKAMPRMNELFDENKDNFTKDEWQAATDAYRKGFVAKELHGIVQDGFNMSPEYAETTGETRRWTGSQNFVKRFDNLMADHGDDVRSMIGNEGISSLRRMNSLLRGQESSGPMADLVTNVARVMRRHGGSVAGMLGGTTGALLGGSHYHGALAGVVTASALQRVVNYMATNPEVADRMAYAVKNKVAPNVAGPLIAAMIQRIENLDQRQPQEKPQ